MNYLLRTGIIFFILSCFTIQTPFAGTLSEDYQELVKQRVELENKRKDYEARIAALSSQKKSLTIVFYQCISQKDKDYWEKKLTEANEANTSLEKERLGLADVRKGISEIRSNKEKQRVEIENMHTYKGPGTQYEPDFRLYMDALKNEYYNMLEQELFPGYDSYIKNLNEYISFLKKTVGKCMKRDLN